MVTRANKIQTLTRSATKNFEVNPSPERVFLGWSKPVVQSVSGYLLGEKELVDPLVVTPTRQAERLLRARLEAATFTTPLSACTPGNLPEMLLGPATVAATELSRAAWILTLRNAPADRLSGILGPAPKKSPQSVFRLLEFITGCRQMLAESLLDFSAMAEHPSAREGLDAERWQCLKLLEQDYRNYLKKGGMIDRDDHFRDSLQAGRWSKSLPSQVILAACPDLPRRSIKLLQSLPDSIPVRVLIAAPNDLAHQFDDYGQAIAETFSRQPVPLPASAIHQHPNLSGFLQETADYLSTLPERAESAVLGALDSSASAAAVYELTIREIPVYDPSGSTLAHSSGGLYLKLLHDAFRQEGIESLDALMRHPCFVQYLRQQSLIDDDNAYLSEWEKFRAEHFPRRKSGLLPLLRSRRPASARLLRPVFEHWEKLCQEFGKAGGFFAMLETTTGTNLLKPAREQEKFCQLWDSLAAAQLHLKESRTALPVSGAEMDTLLLRLLSSLRSPAQRPADAVEVLGWLELAWDPRPQLFLLDAFEGRLPTPQEENPLLPDFLREATGLPNRKSRLERDAYLFRLLAELRTESGRLVVALPAMDDRQEPVQPSRFLFSVPTGELPDRVLFLTRDNTPPPPLTEIRQPPSLTPASPERWIGELKSVSASQFKSYLRHPFEFYLEQACGMRRPDPARLEMDPAAFGHLAHAVIEEVEMDADLIDCEDSARLQQAFRHYLDSRFDFLFGKKPNAFLLMQRESLFQRLTHLAELRTEDRAQGWRVEQVEWRLHDDLRLLIEGLPLHGKVDLIERHSSTGALRIIDFKTTDTNDGPEAAHCRKAYRSGPPRPAFPVKSRPGLFWKDLQLPLYAEAASRHYGVKSIAVGYYTLTRAVSEISWQEWPLFTNDLRHDALECAEQIVHDWREFRFWLPDGKLLSEEFAALSNRSDMSDWQPGYLKEVR